MIDGRLRPLIGRLWRQHRAILFVLAAGLAIFEFVITRVAPLPGEAGFLGGVVALLPPQVSSIVGGELALASSRGVLAFGYLHPFFLALLSAWTIRVASSALAGEIGRGTMDLLAARPVPRWAQPLAAWLTIAAGLAILAGAAWAGMAIGLNLRSLGVTPQQIIALPAMAWLLFMSWAAIALVASALGRDAGSAISWTSGIIVVSFVLEFVSRVWRPLAWTEPFTLFAYYRPQDIVRTGVALADPVLLSIVCLTGLILAAVIFHRRDL
jgi:ABC-2 type transport system permease protein